MRGCMQKRGSDSLSNLRRIGMVASGLLVVKGIRVFTMGGEGKKASHAFDPATRRWKVR